MIKTCPECKETYPVDRVLCVGCLEDFESGPYLWFIAASMAAAAALLFALRFADIASAVRVLDVLTLGTGFLLVGYTVLKIVHKLRDRRRPVWREVVCLYASRWDRLVVGGALLVLVLLPLELLPMAWTRVPSIFADPGHRQVWSTFRLVTCGYGVLVSIGMIVTQGWDFFDPRVAHTYESSETARGIIAALGD